VWNKLQSEINKKDSYRQRNVRQFLQSAWHIIWLPHESHGGMLLPSAVAGADIWLRQESLRHILASLGTPVGQSR